MAFVLHQLYVNPVQLSTASYDNMVRHRLFAPKPDLDIVIVDIDEASLAALSGEHGRWPWPRDTLAASLTYLERSGAAGVVFDILMSDPDRQNPASDEAFADSVGHSKIAWFPVLRLNPVNDATSQLKLSQLAGFAHATADAKALVTVAAVPPFFNSALQAKRLGYHNVYPDADSIIRSYRYIEAKDGWRIQSLPASIALSQNWPLPARGDTLLNWPKAQTSYTTIPFHRVLEDGLKKTPTLDPTAFKGKWVLIGSTAPALHDVKATPLKAIHPGVEVLATALDNAKNSRYLYLIPRWLVALLALLVLLGSIKLVRVYSQTQLSFAFVFVPALLLLTSFVSLHVGSYFVDLTLPAQAAFFMLSFVKAHAQVLAWAHSRKELLCLDCKDKTTVFTQTVAATPASLKAVPDWSIFEALRHHTGVLYLDNRSSKHPLSDNDYRWWTIITASPEASAEASATHLSFQRVANTCFERDALNTISLSELHSTQPFSEAIARSHFWAAVAQHDQLLSHTLNDVADTKPPKSST